MKRLVFLALVLLASSANAVEFIKIDSYKECNQIKSEIEQEYYKTASDVKGKPKHWIRRENMSGYQFVDIRPTFGDIFAPDGTQLINYTPMVRNNRVITIFCNAYQRTQWMAISTFEEDLARYQAYLDREAQKKKSAQDFLKKHGI